MHNTHEVVFLKQNHKENDLNFKKVHTTTKEFHSKHSGTVIGYPWKSPPSPYSTMEGQQAQVIRSLELTWEI